MSLSNENSSFPSRPRSRGSHFDTTPSPSGVTKSAHLDPRALSSNPTPCEASESMAHAIETLAISPNLNKTAEEPVETDKHLGTPTTKDTTKIAASQHADISGVEPNVTLPQASHELHSATFSQAESATNVAPLRGENNVQRVAAEMQGPPTDEPDSTSDGSEDLGDNASSVGSQNEDVSEEPGAETTLDDGQAHPLPSLKHGSNARSAPENTHSLIVLDQGFDELPAISKCVASSAKTICVWRYWGSAMNIGHVIRSISSKPTIVPASLGRYHLKAAAKQFSLRSFKGILLWPAHESFARITNGNPPRKTQIIFAGNPSEKNKDLKTPKGIIIMSLSEWRNLSPDDAKHIRETCFLDPMHRSFNRQVGKTTLDSGRQFMRTYLSDVQRARALCIAWITWHRRANRRWPIEDVVKRANLYAEEYLLHGGPGGGRNWIGGTLSFQMKQIKGMNMEPAVEAGLLSVA